jgi:hypothetical protein
MDLAPYTSILRAAIESAPGQQAYLCEIYSYLQDHFACFKVRMVGGRRVGVLKLLSHIEWG